MQQLAMASRQAPLQTSVKYKIVRKGAAGLGLCNIHEPVVLQPKDPNFGNKFATSDMLPEQDSKTLWR